MNADSLVQQLAGLMASAPDGSQWRPRKPVQRARLDELEAEYGIRLPADLRAVLEVYGGGTLVRPGTTPLGIGPMSDLFNLNGDPFFEENIPGMFVFGGDGGGSVYSYDPENALGRGEYAIFIVPMGDLALDAARYVARDLAEAVEGVLAGRDPYA